MTSTAGRNAKTSRGFIFRLAVSLGLLTWLALKVDWNQVGQMLVGSAWYWFPVALLGSIGNIYCSTLKWQWLVQARNVAARYRDLLRYCWISNFANSFLPSAVGGDGLRMFALICEGVPISTASSSVVVERVSGALALVAMSVFSGIYCWVAWGKPQIAMIVLVPSLIVIAIAAMAWNRRLWRVALWLYRRNHFKGFKKIGQIHRAIFTYQNKPGVLWNALWLSFVVQGLRIFTIWMSAVALRMDIGPSMVALLLPPILLVTMLPISIGTWGIRESSFVFCFALAGVPKEEAFALGFITHILLELGNVPGGFMYLSKGLVVPSKIGFREARG